MVGTLVATPDPQWWDKVFTPEEYERLNSKLEEIVNEYEVQADDLVDLIVAFPTADVPAALKALGPSYGDGHPLVDKLIEALANEYYANVNIPVDKDCARLYERIILEDDEDEDDWFA